MESLFRARLPALIFQFRLLMKAGWSGKQRHEIPKKKWYRRDSAANEYKSSLVG